LRQDHSPNREKRLLKTQFLHFFGGQGLKVFGIWGVIRVVCNLDTSDFAVFRRCLHWANLEGEILLSYVYTQVTERSQGSAKLTIISENPYTEKRPQWNL
jgi:hypothetical protein